MKASRALTLFLPPLAFQALIYFLSSRKLVPVGPEGADKLVHFAAYGFLAFLWIRALGAGSYDVSPRKALAAVVLTTLFGLSDEIHQSFVPGRTASGWDLLADALGAASVAVLVHLGARRTTGQGAL